MIDTLKKWVKRSNTFPYFKIKTRPNTPLVVVKDQQNKCITDAEKLLYNQLRYYSYYPTPHYTVSGITINLALIPYKLALIEKKHGMNEKRIIRILKKRKWRVLFYDATQIKNDEQKYVHIIQKYAPIQIKNVSI